MCIGGGQPDTPDPDPLPQAPPPPPIQPPPLPLPSIRPSRQAEEGDLRLKIGRKKSKNKPTKGSLKSLRTPLNQPVAAQPQGINNPKPNP